MMKYMLTATALVLILMVMWLPARTPPEIFEETALREALMLRTGEGEFAYPSFLAVMPIV